MVDIAPEDHDPANWKSWLEDDNGNLNEDELPWYGRRDESPNYGPDAPPAAQVEAARRFVSHWLNEDGHGFVIPGGEWGVSLKHWLHILVARPAVDAQRPQEAAATHRSQDVGTEVAEGFSRADLAPLTTDGEAD